MKLSSTGRSHPSISIQALSRHDWDGGSRHHRPGNFASLADNLTRTRIPKFTFHSYPFEDLNGISTHVHPVFIIAQAALALQSLEIHQRKAKNDEAFTLWLANERGLLTIRNIYAAWTTDYILRDGQYDFTSSESQSRPEDVLGGV